MPRPTDSAAIGDAWAYSEEPVSDTDTIRLPGLLQRAFAYPRFLSIGSHRNTVEVRMSRELYEEIRAVIGGSALSEGTNG